MRQLNTVDRWIRLVWCAKTPVILPTNMAVLGAQFGTYPDVCELKVLSLECQKVLCKVQLGEMPFHM